MNRSRRSYRGARGSCTSESWGPKMLRREISTGWWQLPPASALPSLGVKRGGRFGRPALLPAIPGYGLVVTSRGQQREKTRPAPAAQGHRAECGGGRGGREE